MSDINFSVRISEKRSKEINKFLRSKEITNQKFIENMIDHKTVVWAALDATTGRKAK